MQDIPEWQSRTAMMLGADGVRRLASANVLVVGVGGVGAMAAEMLCRAGVGKMTIVDGDVVEATNRNRQLPALVSSDGKTKTDVMFHRLKDINPDCDIKAVCEFLKDDKMTEVLTAEKYDYVVDAIDTLSPKAHLIRICREKNIPVVSSMGSGARLDPTAVRVTDIAESFNCPLAKAIRRRLRRMGVSDGVKVVFSTEGSVEDAVLAVEDDSLQNKRSITGTISYMPAVFGCVCASVVIRDLAGQKEEGSK